MGWADALAGGTAAGRAILMKGRWAARREAPTRIPRPRATRDIPFVAPDRLLSRPLLRLFNELYFRGHQPRRRRGIVHPEAFFYPLDRIGRWNRLYGRRGMTQYQCVLPDGDGRERAARAFFRLLGRLRANAFLCVVKDCGEEGEGLLSFPRPGISIAVDLPVEPGTPELVRRLNEFVIGLGGRVYLTKDRFTTASEFRRMEPRLPRFLEVRKRWDPEGRLRSAQSVRLFGDSK
jgi:FAD/FMN-containing dehydrogenase